MQLITVPFDGEEYTLDLDHDLTANRLRVMKAAYGFTVSSFMEQLADGDVDALSCALWIMKNRAGKQGDPKKMGDFNAAELRKNILEALGAAVVAAESDDEPDPTAAGAPTPVSTPTPPSSSASTDSSSPISAT